MFKTAFKQLPKIMNVLKAHCDQRSVSKNSKSIYFPLVLNENELEQTFQFFAEL